jgi:TfoX/Sxy family transcriptional regulator of competence genes
MSTVTPQERYATLVNQLLSNPDVTQSEKRGFGSGLRVNGKVFAMLVKGKLVVKLPQQRVISLITSGEGEPYYYGNGRVTKEWVTVESASEERWLPLAQEALEFADSKQ